MKLLVAGASGFIGRNVVEAASRAGWNVTGLYWKSKTFAEFAKQTGCQAVRHNLLKGDGKEWDADVCIYVAGNSDHSMSLRSPLNDLRLNVEALNRFVMGFHGGVVLLSSAAVYDGNTGLVSPTAKTKPVFPYGISKLTAEEYLRYWAHEGQIPWSTVLRLYYAYGPYDREQRLICKLVRAAARQDHSFTVTAPERSLIDPVYSTDVAAALLAAASGKAKDSTLDLCSGWPLTVRRLLRGVTKWLDASLSLTVQPRISGWPVRYYSEPDALRRKLGMKRFVPLREGVRRYAGWIRERAEPTGTALGDAKTRPSQRRLQ